MEEIKTIKQAKNITKEVLDEALAKRHGAELQKKLSEAKVAICGLGGLGSNIAVMLARAGIRHLHLIDFDDVDISNLNRQQYFVNQLGEPKPKALAKTLEMIYPYVELKLDYIKITPENVQNLLKDDDIICEAFDRPDQKAMLVENVLMNFPKKKLVAASGMAGIDSSNSIKTKRIGKNFYLCGDQISDLAEGDGLFAPRVCTCASHQAMTVIRLIAGKDEL